MLPNDRVSSSSSVAAKKYEDRSTSRFRCFIATCSSNRNPNPSSEEGSRLLSLALRMGSTRLHPADPSPHGIEPDGSFASYQRLGQESALNFSVLDLSVPVPAEIKIRDPEALKIILYFFLPSSTIRMISIGSRTFGSSPLGPLFACYPCKQESKILALL